MITPDVDLYGFIIKDDGGNGIMDDA
jgi:hypothetical protein